jgi:two-component system, NtrC family, response regulator AtoC
MGSDSSSSSAGGVRTPSASSSDGSGASTRADTSRLPLLIVDDEQDNLDAFRIAFRRSFQLSFARSGAEALAMLDGVRPAVVVTDQRMPGMGGIELLTAIRQRRPTVVGVLLTAYTDLPVLLDAIHSGAVHRYVQKPWDASELGLVLKQCLEHYSLAAENAELRKRLARYAGYLEREQRDPLEFGALSGESEPVRKVATAIARAAETDAPALIVGETGVGKRTVARAIHTQSEREHGPFVELLAQGYDADGQERELRGWLQGAVPGALPERAGRIELSYGGTLLIEEVGALGPAAQRTLSRALLDGFVERLGSGEGLHVPVRLIATTTEDLSAKVAAGTFDPELYQRLCVCLVRVPSLRERIEDLPALAEHTLLRLAKRSPRIPRRLSLEAHAALAKYPFPGNVRELENVLERAAIHCRGDIIEAGHLAFGGARSASFEGLATAPAAAVGSGSAVSTSASAGAASTHGSVADGTAQRINLDNKLEDMERRELIAALERCQGNKAEVARVLGVQRTTLYYRLRKLGIDV